MKFLISLLCMILLPTTVWADPLKWSTHVALGSYMTLAGVDIAQTAYCLGAQTCVEVNPIANWGMARYGIVPTLGTKMAVNTAVTFGLLHLRKSHPQLAFWMAVSAASIQAAAVIHNAHQ